MPSQSAKEAREQYEKFDGTPQTIGEGYWSRTYRGTQAAGRSNRDINVDKKDRSDRIWEWLDDKGAPAPRQ